MERTRNGWIIAKYWEEAPESADESDAGQEGKRKDTVSEGFWPTQHQEWRDYFMR